MSAPETPVGGHAPTDGLVVGGSEREAATAPPTGFPENDAIRLPCRACGPGYRIGDEGCRHSDTFGGYVPEVGETGICRTCVQPIWWEVGQIDHRDRGLGWSDRIKRGGDSLVCFKAAEYRHVPMGGREAAIYEAGFKAGREADHG